MAKNRPDALEEQRATGYAGRGHSRRLHEAATNQSRARSGSCCGAAFGAITRLRLVASGGRPVRGSPGSLAVRTPPEGSPLPKTAPRKLGEPRKLGGADAARFISVSCVSKSVILLCTLCRLGSWTSTVCTREYGVSTRTAMVSWTRPYSYEYPC
jgi:hypothetical protein